MKIIPETRKNEVLSFLKLGLEDISFSRPRKDLEWGIPIPDDETQTIYVWCDALSNYISALGYVEDGEKFKKYWPADVHCIGKDIIRFHTTIWEGILLSLGLELPRIIFVHGFITADGQKMSKSLGNVIDPFELVKKYGTDAVRYYLLREIPPTKDGDFTYQKFEERYNDDLAKGLGNLTARIITLTEKVDSISEAEGNKLPKKLKEIVDKTQQDYKKSLDEFKFNEVLIAIWNLISFCDRNIEKEKPWEESEKQKEIISNLLFLLENIVQILRPILPETSEKILQQIKTKKSEPLFPRI